MVRRASSGGRRVPGARAYKKGIGVLKEIRLDSINKEGLLKKELSKGDIGGTTTLLLRVISFLD